MSVRFQILKVAFKWSGMKKLFGLPKEKLLAKAAQINSKRGFAIPKDKKHTYTDISVGANDHCLKIQKPGTHYERAMLFCLFWVTFSARAAVLPGFGTASSARQRTCSRSYP